MFSSANIELLLCRLCTIDAKFRGRSQSSTFNTAMKRDRKVPSAMNGPAVSDAYSGMSLLLSANERSRGLSGSVTLHNYWVHRVALIGKRSYVKPDN